MTSYLIKYQTRRKHRCASIPQGEWQDKEIRVVAGEDAREALDEILGTFKGFDFRLRGIEVCGQIDVIAQKLR
ncbi:hypothetical protein LCGC14_0220820 [marine sediment metagenome]|uniref:Uncharacterized protein n=1 Tax=marine sediment metagenome TaxID=412755 RepID=A0A0F9UHR5_9ZZZZ